MRHQTVLVKNQQHLAGKLKPAHVKVKEEQNSNVKSAEQLTTENAVEEMPKSKEVQTHSPEKTTEEGENKVIDMLS